MTKPNFEPLLVTKEDFVDFRDISVNMDDVRIDPYIREAQMIDIQDFLGDALYQAMMADYTAGTDTFTEARFTDLWFGIVYKRAGLDVHYNGLKPALVYYAYERQVFNQPLNVTRYGTRILEDNELSTNPETGTRRYEINADSIGLVYQRASDVFLKENAADYPEWNKPEEKAKKKTALRMLKIGQKIGR